MIVTAVCAFLLLVAVLSALRVGGQRGDQWDVMSAYQRRALLDEREQANPAFRRSPR